MQDDIQHAHGGRDGGIDLVGMDPAGLDLALVGRPGDGALGEGIAAPALGDAHLVVLELGQGDPLPLHQPRQGVVEGIEAAVAAPRGGQDLLAQAQLDTGGRLQVEAGGDGAGKQLRMVVVLAVQDLGDDEGQVLGGDALLGIPQLDDPREHPPLILLRQADIQPFQILGQRRLARQFAEGILAPPGKTLG